MIYFEIEYKLSTNNMAVGTPGWLWYLHGATRGFGSARGTSSDTHWIVIGEDSKRPNKAFHRIANAPGELHVGLLKGRETL